MENCWFCGYDIRLPSKDLKDQGHRPFLERQVFDITKSIMKTVKICQFCYMAVNSSLSSKGLQYRTDNSYDRMLLIQEYWEGKKGKTIELFEKK